MNCKPGDLAIVVRGRSGKNDGKIVRVIRRAANEEPIGKFLACAAGDELTNVSWMCSGNDLYTGRGEGPLQEWVFRDSVLRPIRDPGEDATDETLTWLPVPSRERETV